MSTIARRRGSWPRRPVQPLGIALVAACAALAALGGCGGDDPAAGPGDAAAGDLGGGGGDVALDTAAADSAQADGAAGAGCTTAADCPASTTPCRTAACQAGVGCVEVLLVEGAVCKATEPCATGGHCSKGACVADALRDCDDDEPCTADGCEAGDCVHTPLTAAEGAPAPCDDGEPCTVGDACKDGACAPGKSTCACVEDADCDGLEGPCKGEWICDKSAGGDTCTVVAASLVNCGPSPSPCLLSQCVPATGACGLVPVADGKNVPCDDDDACTSGDVCKKGGCVPGADVCGCGSDADCLDQDDGDFCNGVPFCNKASKPAACELNPATIVSCKSVDDTGCSKNLCEPASGQCKVKATNEGGACDDGNVCTQGEVCKAGVCASDANTCTCKSDADCASKDDGDLCNGTMFCDLGAGGGAVATCKVNPATVVSCPSVDDAYCIANVCDPKSGVCGNKPRNEGLGCNDGDPCTSGEVCVAGACKAGADANLCACQGDSDCAAKEDGDACNGTLYCDKSAAPFVCKVNPKTIVTCSDAFDSACQKAQCDAKTGACLMTPVNSGLPCDDGVPCTKDDYCKAGQCASGTQICECKGDLDCAGKDDGNLCNGVPYCDKSALPWSCAINPATVVSCPTVDDTFCRKRICTPQTGLCEFVAVNQGVSCDDASACTVDEVCKNGGCSGAKVVCDDGVPCTADGCDPVTGCVAPTAQGICDDGDACTADLCAAKEPGADKLGCVHKAQTATPCDDGDACTADDACVLGACKGKPTSCDDGNACTDDGCASSSGCTHTPNAAPCKSSAACQPFGQCSAGACAPLPAPFWQATVDGKDAEVAAAIAAGADGAAWIAGRAEVGGGGSADPQLFVARVAPGGATSKLWLFGGAGDDAGLGVATVDAGGIGKSSDIGALVVGRRAAGSKGGADAWLLRVKADGSVLWQQHAGGAGDDEATAVVTWQAGAAAVAGRLGSGDAAAFWVVRVDKLGTVLWQASLAGPSGAAHGVDRAADGGLFASGTRKDDVGMQGATLARLAADGVVLWAKDFGLGKGMSGVNPGWAVRALAGGGAIVASGNGGGGRLLRVGGDGALGWDLAFGAGDGGALSSLSPEHGGALTAYGFTKGEGKQLPWMLHVGADGTLLWQRKEQAQAGSSAPVGTSFADGRTLLAWPIADKTTTGAAVRVVARDPWGNVDCEAQGACKGKTLADCDDANPCTFDGCSTELGCTHQVHTLPCDDGDVCSLGEACKAGACVGGKAACDDNNPCTKDVCVPDKGCSHSVVEGECDDGDACTKGEVCKAGVCPAGKLVDCDDGSVCTDDACSKAVGCTHVANTKACDTGNCTVADVCDKGLCTSSGASRYTHTFYGGKGTENTPGLAATLDGGTIIVGRTYNAPTSDGLVIRTDAHGKALWQAVVPGPSGCCGSGSNQTDPDDYFLDALVTPYGILAVGFTHVCNFRAWVAMLDDNGKLKWSNPYVTNNQCTTNNGHRSRAAAVAAGNDGSWAVVGYNWSYPFGNTYAGYFFRVDQTGKKITDKVGLSTRQFFDVASRPNGGYVAAGQAYSGAYGYDGRLMALEADGDVQWVRDFRVFNNGTDDAFFAVAATPDGGALGVGSSGPVGSRQVFVGRASSSSAVLWQVVHGGAADDFAGGAVVYPDGSSTLAATTYSKGPGSGDLWLLHLSADGVLLWQRVHGEPTTETFGDIAERADHSLAVVGVGTPQGEAATDLQQRTFDAWGYADCKSAGSCSALPASGCDDGDPCTADLCASAGCSHTTLPDGVACGGGKQCKAGKCG